LKIIIDDKIPFINDAFRNVADLVFLPGADFSNKLVKDADALVVRTRTKCDRNLLKNSKVKFIATATIGHDHIDQKFCDSANISWCNAQGCNAYSVQQYIASALLHLFSDNLEDLPLKTIGIVGFGNVGRKIYELASLLGMKILINDPPLVDTTKNSRHLKISFKNARFVSLKELASKADVISFHTPLTLDGSYKTFHLADEKFFALLKPETILINTSRGEVVDTRLLKQKLEKEQIKTAVLDVWENEPILDSELIELLALGTPHIAGYSADGKAAGTTMSVQAISNYFNLGLNNWQPENIPLPKTHNITVEKTDDFVLKTLKKIFFQTYDIRIDDDMLRTQTRDFEKLRGNYRLRREPPAYTVSFLSNHKQNDLVEILKKLRFTLNPELSIRRKKR